LNAARGPVYAAPLHRYAAPLRRWLRSRGYLVAATRPPEAYRRVLAGSATAAAVPLALAVRDAGRRVRVTTRAPMVYTLGETMSSIVVSREKRALEDCRAVALSGETRTSAAYLALLVNDYRLHVRLLEAGHHSPTLLLGLAPCALVLGDQALRARSQGLHVVLDVGEALWRLYRAPAVYAVTAAPRDAPRPPALHGPPWPRALQRDAAETAAATGLPLEEAERYHRAVRLDYNPAALLQAYSLARRGLEALKALKTPG